MSLFTEALAKQIVKHMGYRDDEIFDLTRRINMGVVVCGAEHERHTRCNTCGFTTCEDCLYLRSEWIATDLCDYGNYKGDIIIDIGKKGEWENDENRGSPFEHYLYCSDICFKKYYNEMPIVGNVYGKYHFCNNPSFCLEKGYGFFVDCGHSDHHYIMEEWYSCDKCYYKMCKQCYSTKYENNIH